MVLEEAQSTATTSKLNSGRGILYSDSEKTCKMCYLLHCPKNKELPILDVLQKSAARHLRALVYLTRGYQDYADVNDFKKCI